MDTPTSPPSERSGTTAISGALDPAVWNLGVDTLRGALNENDGCISSLALRQMLDSKGVADAREVVVQLKFYDFATPPDDGRQSPDFRWHTHAKSFYSDERYARFKQQQEAEVARAASNEVTAPEASGTNGDEPDPTPVSERRKIRQEEARLGTYVASTLENIYQSDFAPDEAEYVFDVHKERPGSEFENVDVLAVHWRSDEHVELIAVEVKLDFTARLVQQARNYSRFADRVWLAVPITADASDAAAAIREYDPMLFEHVIEIGLGVLACRRRPGKSYEVMPVHWPRRLLPDPVEKEIFLERYRRSFESARVLARGGGGGIRGCSVPGTSRPRQEDLAFRLTATSGRQYAGSHRNSAPSCKV